MSNSQIHKKKNERTYKLSDRVTTPSVDLYHKYKEDKATQFTSLFVRTYASTEEVERLLEVLNPDEYAYIVHDKDVNKDGTPKEPHIHLLMYKKSTFRLTKLFTFTEQATRVEVPRSKKYAYEYLTHKNDPDKTSYPVDAVHEYHKGANTFSVTPQEARENRNLELLDDIGNLTRRQMAEKYGSDYIKNYRRYEEFMSVVERDETQEKCAKLVEELKDTTLPTDQFFHINEFDGEMISLTIADYFCACMRDTFADHGGVLTPDELITLYYQVLQEYREYRASRRGVAY